MVVAPGQVLSGTLRLVRRLADGGMGTVWIADHLVLGTAVAVKVLSGPWASSPDAPARFLREARLTSRIDSPHVVRVLDCRLTEADEPYLVLELLRGETLEQRVRRSGPLAAHELEIVVTQACEALAATHRAGILHRDLKPENLFLVAGPRPFLKLIDFGVARPRAEEEWTSADRLAAGTPQYMSPEQLFTPEDADERSDLFSLASVAYFALTGHAPFSAGLGAREPRWLSALSGVHLPPSARRPELPTAVDAWFARALAPEPAARFAGARAMAEALSEALRAPRASVAPEPPKSFLRFAPPPAEPAPFMPRPALHWPSLSRSRGALGGFAAVSVVLVVAAELALRVPRRAPPNVSPSHAAAAAHADVALRDDKARYPPASPPVEVGDFRACR